jgi:BirA family biotin operon repressor/biotin-[acetyl-CoA-carboxylase] ligase
MNRARELANQGAESGTVVIAERQSAGRGRNGRTWVSRQGGLFFTILERPRLAIADYSLFSLVLQIAVTRALSKICKKNAALRWPNDIYIDRRKIAGVTTEISGEGDLISWLSGGVGVNVNNPVPSAKTTSIAEVTGRHFSRRAVLQLILLEYERAKKTFASHAAYSQGSHSLADEWNSLADCIGAKAAVFEPQKENEKSINNKVKIFARGTFLGVDPAGRCILKTDTAKGTLYFNQGSVSMTVIS